MSDKFSVIIRCKNEERWVDAIQSVIDHIPITKLLLLITIAKIDL